MKGEIWLGIFLTYYMISSSVELTAGRSPKEVTIWDSEDKKIYYEPLKPKLVSEYKNKYTCSAFGKDDTLVDWGITIPNGTEEVPCSDGNECIDYGVAKVIVTYEDNCERIHWTTSDLGELKDCIYLLGHWYGGGQQFTQPWPIEFNPRTEVPFVTSDNLGNPLRYGGVTERFWVSSEGIAVKVENTLPLFFSMPDSNGDDRADTMCLSSKYEKPYVMEEGAALNLTYYICYADDVKEVYETTFPKFFQNPRDIPDKRMLTHPVWSTWAEYLTEVNETNVLNLAQTIIDQGFNNSQLEIDDNWETCYGDAIFDTNKFPDPKGLVDTLHAMNYRVTLWIHPFINADCESFAFADQNGYFIKNATGQTQLTSWWQGDKSGLIDSTNPDAVNWWTQRLETLRTETGLDSFKFDAGETSWMPEDYTLSLNKEYWPDGYTTAYVNSVSPFGNLIEVRVGHDSQEDPVFVRMLDKYSYWSDKNGLKTLIPSLLHSGLVGYPFVLPDMVGGNAYTGRPSPELFIRWAQANTFMPAIQFSLLPWEFDSELGDVAEISRQVAATHARYAPLIIELAQNATNGDGPIIRPTWWLCPTDEDCLLANQQFLLGNDLLVTPVTEESADTLEVVFPPGTWRQHDNGALFEGPSRQTISDININSNIYYRRLF